MVNQEQLHGRWDEVRGKLRERWGALTNDEFESARGNLEQLVGLIERRTGETRQAIEEYLGEVLQQAPEIAARARETARNVANRTADIYDDAQQRARAGMERTSEFIGDHPAGSVAGLFTVGLVIGVALGFAAASR